MSSTYRADDGDVEHGQYHDDRDAAHDGEQLQPGEVLRGVVGRIILGTFGRLIALLAFVIRCRPRWLHWWCRCVAHRGIRLLRCCRGDRCAGCRIHLG